MSGSVQRLFVVDRFSSHAKSMRRYYDEVFGESASRGADPRRFCWDFWNVPGQYRLHRTPAYHFFPQELYRQFHEELVLWGRRTLGCHDISPPWMSCYTDGCEQNLHGDLPHGPWSFVFSLTPWRNRRFSGGETLLLREEMLSFWQLADLSRGMEEQDVLEAIEPVQNRLVVFDPRIPHGVRRVSGAQSVAEGRLVIHGWFVNPRPFIEGPLSQRELSTRIPQLLAVLDQTLGGSAELHGMLSYRFQVDASGGVRAVRLLAQSLRVRAGAPDAPAHAMAAIAREIRRFRFSAKAAGSQVTLPLVFSN